MHTLAGACCSVYIRYVLYCSSSRSVMATKQAVVFPSGMLWRSYAEQLWPVWDSLEYILQAGDLARASACIAAASVLCRDVVIETATDDFYRKNLYNNYGEVGLSVKELVDKFSQASEQHKQVGVSVVTV